MTAERNVELMKRWVDAINRNELSAIEESVARDFIRHDLSGTSPDLVGIERLTEFVKTLRAGLPDMEVTIEDIFATDDRVAMSITTVGTHAGEFLGFPRPRASGCDSPASTSIELPAAESRRPGSFRTWQA